MHMINSGFICSILLIINNFRTLITGHLIGGGHLIEVQLYYSTMLKINYW